LRYSDLGPMLQNYVNIEWAKYFWRRNLELSPCQSIKQQVSLRQTLTTNSFNEIVKICHTNAKILENYLLKVKAQYKFDLYSPEKDEVILGLFARVIRLASSIFERPFPWSLDFSRILLRCLSDTTITFCYLILKNDNDLFASFIEYGKGKEKLLLLHLQDSVKKELTPSGETPRILADQLGGGISPEFIDMNLADWKTVSAYEMAKDCDLLDIYRIIYDPTSSDIHGTWTSIKNVNLTYCANPLHRYHRIPENEEPPMFLDPLEIAKNLVQVAINFAQKYSNFPVNDNKLIKLPQDIA
jgi:hypothetical protein